MKIFSLFNSYSYFFFFIDTLFYNYQLDNYTITKGLKKTITSIKCVIFLVGLTTLVNVLKKVGIVSYLTKFGSKIDNIQRQTLNERIIN